MTRPSTDKGQLAIARIPKPLPPEKVAWKLPKALIANLALYREAYKALYNDDIEEETLVELILSNHFAKDKAFLNWLKPQNKALAR